MRELYEKVQNIKETEFIYVLSDENSNKLSKFMIQEEL